MNNSTKNKEINSPNKQLNKIIEQEKKEDVTQRR